MTASQIEQVKSLKESLHLLPKGDQGFAASLLEQFTKAGDLSEKQWFWIGKLADAAEVADVPDFTIEAPKPVHIGQFGVILAFFEAARKYLKYPKITMQLPDGSPLQLALAGANSKHMGSVALTNGGPYGANVWYGRISQKGEWEPAPKATLFHDAIKLTLKKIADNPACAAAEYGKLTGQCCFCNSKLSDMRSTEVGYGKTCAARWGLKWGEKD